MSTDDQHPENRASKEETLRRMEAERARLDADIKAAKEDLREAGERPVLRRAAGDWRKADETGHHEDDERRG
jgi:hypothetical protein